MLVRQNRIARAFSPVALQEDEFLVFEARGKYGDGDQVQTRWEYLIGRFRDGEVECYELPQYEDHSRNLTRYGVRYRIRILAETISTRKPLPLDRAPAVSDIDEIAERVQRYFVRKPHFKSDYNLSVYISRPLGVAGARDSHIIWRWLNIASLLFFLALTAWAIMQVVFLTSALTASPPSPSAELVSTHFHTRYVASLSFHSFAILFGAALVLLEAGPKVWLRIGGSHYVEDKELGSAGYVLVQAVVPLALLGIFLGSFVGPRYEVFIDSPNEQVIKRDTHLQPPGVALQTVQFYEIDVVRGEIVRHTHEKDNGPDLVEFHSLIRITTVDGQSVEVGSGFPAQSSRRYAPEARLLAVTIAEKSDARIRLR